MQKNPSTRAGVVSLLAVTHQGPAQGGKAGDSKLSKPNLAKLRGKSKPFSNNFDGAVVVYFGLGRKSACFFV
jgi:hypothetical protein